jgi:hypothetical protein
VSGSSEQGAFWLTRIAGLGAGATEAVAVVTPMEVIKIRLQAQQRESTVCAVCPVDCVEIDMPQTRSPIRSTFRATGTRPTPPLPSYGKRAS